MRDNGRALCSQPIGAQVVATTAFEDFPNVIVGDLSTVNVGPEQNAPQSYIQNVYQLADTFNYIRGSHSFKFGVEGKKYIAPTDGLTRARGEWDYTTLSQLVNDFVPNGAPNKALRGAGSGSVPENYPAIYWFVGDDWKLTSRLTLNLGLRYEYVGVPLGDKRQALNSISDDPGLGLFFRAPKADTNTFAPRIGVAYDPSVHGHSPTRAQQELLHGRSSYHVRYTGTRSSELPGKMRLNSASEFDPRFKALGGDLTPLPTYITASDVPGVVTAPASTAMNFDDFNSAPYSVDGFFGSLTTFPPAGTGIYHAVTVDFMHRFARGLYFRANYSFSRNIDDATNELFSSVVNPRRAQDGYNFGADRGLSALHIPQKFTITWVYELPNIQTEHALLRTLAHGWEWSGSYLAESGQPVTPLSDADANANGDGAGDRTIFNPNRFGNTGTIVDAVCNSV